MVGGDEIEVQELSSQAGGDGVELKEEKMLTDEEVKEIKEEVDEKDAGELLLPLLKKTIETILTEEFFETNTKMNEFRRVLARGVLVFAEKHTEGWWIHSFRFGRWIHSERLRKSTRNVETKRPTTDVFMEEMDNELWIPEDSGMFGV